MKCLWKVGVAITCCLLLVACGRHSEHINLKKEGTQYTIHNVSFYYPNRYVLDGEKTDNKSIHFHKDTESIFYEVYMDETVNVVTDKDDLYMAELEQKGASKLVISEPILDSGLPVYEIAGSYETTGIAFKHIVYFTETHTYVYGYVATAEEYKKNSEEITPFLHSIVIEETNE